MECVGLENFLTSRPRIGPIETKFDKQGNLVPLDPKKNPFVTVKLDITKWKEKMYAARDKIWDFKSNIETNKDIKDLTMADFIKVATMLFPALSELIPSECLNTICQTQRQFKGLDSIGSLKEQMLNATKETMLLIEDTAKEFINATNEFISNIGNFTESLVANTEAIINSFNIYKLCPRRFNDWLDDIVDSYKAFLPPNPIDKFKQIQKKFNNAIMGQFGKILNNCVLKTVTKTAINELTELTHAQKQQLIVSANARRL